MKVLYFGVLKDAVGLESELLELAEGSTAGALVASIEGRGAGQPKLWSSLAIAVNREYAQATSLLHDGDEVALLPPVSGGAA